MLGEDDLKALADDIAANGLIIPIVLDTEGRILDGRNRQRACELAGIEPRYETYDGPNPETFPLRINGQRRQMTQAQKAVTAAKIVLLPRNEWITQQAAADLIGIAQAQVAMAVAVLTYAPSDADDILDSQRRAPLKPAYERAQAVKRAAAERDSKYAELDQESPDLATQVGDGRELSDAYAEHRGRVDNARSLTHQLAQALQALAHASVTIRTTGTQNLRLALKHGSSIDFPDLDELERHLAQAMKDLRNLEGEANA